MRKKTKKLFLAKSDKLKIVVFCIWLYLLIEIFGDIPKPVDTDDLGYRVFLALCATLPLVLYFFSGQSVQLDFVRKTVRRRFVLLKIPLAGREKPVPVREVFLLPEILSFVASEREKEVAYNICAGEFVKKEAENPPEEEGRKKRMVSRRRLSAQKSRDKKRAQPAYFVLKYDTTNFKKAESLIRKTAEALEVPARIYWGEIKAGAVAESKIGPELAKPFKESDLVKDIEEDPLWKSLKKKHKQKSGPASAAPESEDGSSEKASS